MTDWLSAIGILLSGLIVGFMFVYASMRKKETTDDIDRRDLEAKRDALIEQLRAGNLSPEERTRTEREAANVLRFLDSAVPLSGAPAPPPARMAAPAKSSAIAGFAWGAGSVIAIGLIAWFATKSATPKTESAPATPSSIEQLEATVKSNPDDSEARISLAKAYLDRENLMGVFEQTNAVLAKNPNEPRAQTYQAIVRMAMGQPDQAKKMLEAATAAEPRLTDAWVALAWLHSQQSDREGATRAIEEAVKQHPEDEQRLRGILAQMLQRTSGAAPAQPSSAGHAVHVVLNLSPGARTTGVIYVIARAAGQTSGPPAAVKRVEVTSFPISVDLTDADSMMGQPLPGKMRIDVRLDGDGNAMTNDPADPKASQDGVAPGASVLLTLK